MLRAQNTDAHLPNTDPGPVGGLGWGRVCPRKVRRQHSGPWSHWFCSICPPGKSNSPGIRQVRERSQPRNHFPRTLQSIKEARGLHDQPSSSAGNSLPTTGGCGMNKASCALLTLQRGISLYTFTFSRRPLAAAPQEVGPTLQDEEAEGSQGPGFPVPS